MRQVNIYTCTSFTGIKKQDGAAAYILEMTTEKDPVTLQDSLILQNETPNCAELKVVIEALKRMRQKCELVIYTESQYVAAGYNTGWVASWKENDWHTARGTEVSNREQWEQLDNLLQGHEFTFRCEEAHSYRRWLRGEVERKAKEIEHV